MEKSLKITMKASVATVAMALLLSPAVGAWSSLGGYEPDTTLDLPTFMWSQPGPASADRVYFNAWTKVYFVGNPNVGTLETANEVPTLEGHEAILGVWVDCNGDGFVGHAETAMSDYRVELLLDDSICPPVTGSPNNWVEGAHNYNGWVTELIPIAGPHDTAQGNDTRVYRDPDARVWGDSGRPDDSTEASGGGSCPIEPLPRGTWASTGGLLNYADCGTGLLEAWNLLWSTEQAGDPLGLSVPDDDNAEDSPLDFPLFGSDSTDHAAVSVIDCDAAPTLDTAAELNNTGVAAPVDSAIDSVEGASGLTIGESWELWGFTVPGLDPQTENLGDPTVPGQVNQTFEEQDDCDTSNDDGHDFYELLDEGDNTANPIEGKHAAEQNFVYDEAARGGLPFNLVPPGSSGTAGASPFYGVQPGIRNVFVTTGWFSFNVLIKYGPETIVLRGGLNDEDPTASDPSVDIAGGKWFTYYAYVGPAITGSPYSLKTPGGVGVYGGAQCGDNTSGIHNGWDCDAANWNLAANGEPIDNDHLLAFPNDAYNLRDVDCYDGSTNLGVGLGLAYYGNEPCPRPS